MLLERRAAAWQLAARSQRIADFARRKARLRPASAKSANADALDDSLKFVAAQLLAAPSLDARSASAAAADAIRARCGSQACAEAALALTALAANVAVPRDLRRGAAAAFRTESRVLADALTDST